MDSYKFDKLRWHDCRCQMHCWSDMDSDIQDALYSYSPTQYKFDLRSDQKLKMMQILDVNRISYRKFRLWLLIMIYTWEFFRRLVISSSSQPDTVISNSRKVGTFGCTRFWTRLLSTNAGKQLKKIAFFEQPGLAGGGLALRARFDLFWRETSWVLFILLTLEITPIRYSKNDKSQTT